MAENEQGQEYWDGEDIREGRRKRLRNRVHVTEGRRKEREIDVWLK